MALTLHLPVGYFHALLGFTGVGAPRGSAITFAGKDEGPVTTPSDIATAIITAWGAHIDAVVASTITLSSCRVKLGPMEDGPFAEVSTTNAGAAAGQSAPPQVAVLVRKLTAIGGKQGQGRMYVPGLVETEVDDAGQMTGPKRTAWETAWRGFRTALVTASCPMYLAHMAGTYVNSKKELVILAAKDPTEVIDLTVDAKVATQRRRLRG